MSTDSCFEQIYNFRDLGGHHCGAGHKTRRGVIFRSANTSYATQKDAKVLTEKLKINSILDFRDRKDKSQAGGANLLDSDYPEIPPSATGVENQREDKKRTNNVHGSGVRKRIKIGSRKLRNLIIGRWKKIEIARYVFWMLIGKLAALSIFSLNCTFALAMWLTNQGSPQDNSPQILKAMKKPLVYAEIFALTRQYDVAFRNLGNMASLYKMVLEFAGGRVAAALKFCATKENQPVLFHCASGKDRAGLVAYLLLRACGVSSKTCIEEYHKSDEWAQMQEHFHQISGGHGNLFRSLATDPLLNALRAPKVYMEETEAFLQKRYGGVMNYLDEIGFDKAWRERLKETFVIRV
mmetsp:Transcript_21272/g.29810  ORF Transcript_21272/g.29810 Transcript_21272/m.29810 type:complete len:351 (+) Transcript_21272:3-1055(+)